MHILMPYRFLDQYVGGNSTYARTLADGLRGDGIKVSSFAAGKTPLQVHIGEAIAPLRRRPQDSVLHYVADTGLALKSRSSPTVVTVHGVASRWIDSARRPMQDRSWRMRVRRSLRNADCIITVSDSSAADISDVFNIPHDQIHVIPHGINPSLFEVETAPSPAVAAKLPDQYILYLGNIEPRKNLVSLVEACEAIDSGTWANRKLVVAGRQAWNFEESMEAITKSQRVVYLGFVDDSDRRALMQGAELFVFPSLYEGFGFPVLEALSAGTPVVTTDRGSLRDLAGPSYRLSGTDAHEIAAGLTAAMGDNAWKARCAKDGPVWASQFTWEESVRRHVSVYREVLGS